MASRVRQHYLAMQMQFQEPAPEGALNRCIVNTSCRKRCVCVWWRIVTVNLLTVSWG